MNQAILVINAGSSSIKFSVFAYDNSLSNAPLHLIYRGGISGVGTHARFEAKNAQGELLTTQDLGTASHEQAFTALLDWLEAHNEGIELVAIGHRVVHGGTEFTTPVKIDDTVLAELEKLVPLAPLHQPHNLSPVKVLNKLKAGLPQVTCFDTAFHASQPAIACQFAIPREYTAQGIRRYGFHGLSYEYIVRQLPKIAGNLPSRVVVCHLGNGSSMAAIKDGKSIATTMGFTALDGLPMGTRSGTIDAGVLLHWLNSGMSPKDIHTTLYNKSGLLGVSGISNDMADLIASGTPEAKEAIDLFIYRISREVGSLSAALGGIDALVFTAGIGEHASVVREGVCRLSSWVGLELDEAANNAGHTRISTPNSRVSAWIIPTNEELMIAQHTYRLLN